MINRNISAGIWDEYGKSAILNRVALKTSRDDNQKIFSMSLSLNQSIDHEEDKSYFLQHIQQGQKISLWLDREVCLVARKMLRNGWSFVLVVTKRGQQTQEVPMDTFYGC